MYIPKAVIFWAIFGFIVGPYIHDLVSYLINKMGK